MIDSVLEKNGIRIRPIKDKDTYLIIKWRNNEDVKKHFIFREEFTQKMHESWLSNYVKTGKVAQFIIEDTNSNKALGSVYLRDIDLTHNKAEFGIFMGSTNNMGKGIGTIATKLILEYAFKTLRLHKVFLRVFKNNARAIKSYEKAGFVHEGVFVDDVKIDEEYHSIVFMAMFDNLEGLQ